MRRLIVSALLAFVLIPSAVLAAGPQMPAAPTQFVTDTTGSLDDATVTSLNTELANFHKSTGDNVLVWVGQTTGGEALEDWTIAATEAWKIDMKGKSNSAILFVFMQDHTIRIEVGYSLEPMLTDAVSSQIIRDTMTPLLKAGDVGGAITGGAEQMLLAISPSYASQLKTPAVPPQTDTGDQGSSPSPFAFFIGLFLLFVVISSLARAAHRGNNGYWLAGGLPFFAGFGGGGIGSGFGGPTFGGGGGGFSGGGFGGGFGGGGASGGW